MVEKSCYYIYRMLKSLPHQWWCLSSGYWAQYFSVADTPLWRLMILVCGWWLFSSCSLSCWMIMFSYDWPYFRFSMKLEHIYCSSNLSRISSLGIPMKLLPKKLPDLFNELFEFLKICKLFKATSLLTAFFPWVAIS